MSETAYSPCFETGDGIFHPKDKRKDNHKNTNTIR